MPNYNCLNVNCYLKATCNKNSKANAPFLKLTLLCYKNAENILKRFLAR